MSLILAVIYFFDGAWFTGAFLLFVWHWIGFIGQSLHRDKTFAELAQGGLTSEENITHASDMSNEEAHTLARSSLSFSWLCGITVGVLLFHHDYRWFVTLVAGVAVIISTSLVIILVAIRPKK